MKTTVGILYIHVVQVRNFSLTHSCTKERTDAASNLKRNEGKAKNQQSAIFFYTSSDLFPNTAVHFLKNWNSYWQFFFFNEKYNTALS